MSSCKQTIVETMSASAQTGTWGAEDSRSWIRVPDASDDKYSHGVLGVFTGSTTYPGAAVLSVEAATRTGLGMVRYFGPEQPTRLVLERRPEVVTIEGRVDAYLSGSGVDPTELAADAPRNEAVMDALVSGLPVVLDAGALGFVTRSTGPTIITPHHRELARMLDQHGVSVSLDDITADPGTWALRSAEEFGVTVILKGSHTHICSAATSTSNAFYVRVDSETAWMATAGTGDVLAGIAGALVATASGEVLAQPHTLGALAATAAFLHAEAGYVASAGGPIAALDVAQALPRVIATLVAGRS